MGSVPQIEGRRHRTSLYFYVHRDRLTQATLNRLYFIMNLYDDFSRGSSLSNASEGSCPCTWVRAPLKM